MGVAAQRQRHAALGQRRPQRRVVRQRDREGAGAARCASVRSMSGAASPPASRPAARRVARARQPEARPPSRPAARASLTSTVSPSPRGPPGPPANRHRRRGCRGWRTRPAAREIAEGAREDLDVARVVVDLITGDGDEVRLRLAAPRRRPRAGAAPACAARRGVSEICAMRSPSSACRQIRESTPPASSTRSDREPT